MKPCEKCRGMRYERGNVPSWRHLEELCKCMMPYRDVVDLAYGLSEKKERFFGDDRPYGYPERQPAGVICAVVMNGVYLTKESFEKGVWVGMEGATCSFEDKGTAVVLDIDLENALVGFDELPHDIIATDRVYFESPQNQS